MSTPEYAPTWAPSHYGCRVVEIGDTGQYAVPGHIQPRRAVAAVLRYLRVDCGCNPRDPYFNLDEGAPRVQHRWLAHVAAGDLDGEDNGWVWADDHIRQPITLVEL